MPFLRAALIKKPKPEAQEVSLAVTEEHEAPELVFEETEEPVVETEAALPEPEAPTDEIAEATTPEDISLEPETPSPVDEAPAPEEAPRPEPETPPDETPADTAEAPIPEEIPLEPEVPSPIDEATLPEADTLPDIDEAPEPEAPSSVDEAPAPDEAPQPEPEPPAQEPEPDEPFKLKYDFTSGERYVDSVSTKTEFDKMLDELSAISGDLLSHEVEKFAVKFTGKFQGDFGKAEADAKKYEAFLGGYITNAAMILYDNGYRDAAIKRLEQAKSILEARKKLEDETEAIKTRVEEDEDAVDLSDILGLFGD